MAWGHSMILLLMAAVVLIAEEAAVESAMERPSTGAVNVEDVSATAQDIHIGRQGVPPPNRGMLTMAFNAMNPLPYFMGGLNGVRQVMQQRLVPFRGMVLNNFQRGLHRNRFRNAGGGHRNFGFHGSGRGYRGGSGGFGSGGGGKPFSSGLRGGDGGGSSHDILQSSLRTTKEPSFSSTENPSFPNDFGTLKPASIVGGKRPTLDSNTRTASPISTINTAQAFSSVTTSTPVILTSPSSSDGGVSPEKKDKDSTRVINIQIPKELQDIPVLEIYMKPNGDISIGPGGKDRDSSPLDTQAPTKTPSEFSDDSDTYSTFSKSDFSVDDPVNFDYDSGIQNFDHFDTNIQTTHLSHPRKINSIQDILRMQTLGTPNDIFSGVFDSGPATRMQSIPLDHENLLVNDPFYVQNPFVRNKPLSNFPTIAPKERQNVNHIYFVPFNMQSSSPGSLQPSLNRSLPDIHQRDIQSSQNDSPVYFIDITLPGKNGKPSVKTSRSKRSLQYDFDDWYPLVSNPMADDPTIGYQPPPLTQVHFSAEPMPKKPMYPVRPENPPVFVMRSERMKPEYDSVYGTENVEYFHIHPKTNTIRAFRPPSPDGGAIRFVSAPQFGEDIKKTEGNHESVPNKEPGFADRADEYTVGSGKIRFPSSDSQYDTNTDYDMEGSFSELRPTAVRGRPGYIYQYASRDYEDRTSQSGRQVSYQNRRIDQPRTGERPALYELLGNHNPESQIEEAPYLGSATDSAGASNIRKVLPPFLFRNGPNRRYSTIRSSSAEPKRRAGVDYEDVTPGSTRSWFLIETKSESPNRKREPSIASYIHPETNSGDESIHYKPYGPVSYVPRGKGRDNGGHINNPHLDDHMNSYKPSTSLVANSLSELLQIFRYTQVTDLPNEKGVTEAPVTLRGFRYTRPTDETPTTPIPNQAIFPSSLRYTPSPIPAERTTTETTVKEKEQGTYFDAVADTNSLDGYLFSDSEASPEYIHPQVRPNIIIIEGKDANDSKDGKRGSSSVSIISSSSATSRPTEPATNEPAKSTVGDLEVFFSGSKSFSSPHYVIHQGHSQVRVFGINSAEDKSPGHDDKIIFSTFPATESTTTSSTTTSTSTTFTTPESTTATPPTTTISTLSTTPSATEDSTTDVTFPDTTLNPSTSIVTEYEMLPIVNNDEYEYYYYDDGVVHDMAVGEDYYSEGGVKPTLKLPNPSGLQPSRGAAYSSEGQNLDSQPSSSAFSYIFQERLPQTEPLLPQPGEPSGNPAKSLGTDTLSVPRAVFFTKRQISRDDVQISNPFEYLSQLPRLERELRKMPQLQGVTPAPHSPRMKRVTTGMNGA